MSSQDTKILFNASEFQQAIGINNFSSKPWIEAMIQGAKVSSSMIAGLEFAKKMIVNFVCAEPCPPWHVFVSDIVRIKPPIKSSGNAWWAIRIRRHCCGETLSQFWIGMGLGSGNRFVCKILYNYPANPLVFLGEEEGN